MSWEVPLGGCRQLVASPSCCMCACKFWRSLVSSTKCRVTVCITFSTYAVGAIKRITRSWFCDQIHIGTISVGNWRICAVPQGAHGGWLAWILYSQEHAHSNGDSTHEIFTKRFKKCSCVPKAFCIRLSSWTQFVIGGMWVRIYLSWSKVFLAHLLKKYPWVCFAGQKCLPTLKVQKESTEKGQTSGRTV